MGRLLMTALLVAVAALLAAGPALAGQCPKLIAQINNAVGNRFDAASNDAKVMAAEAQKLHNDAVAKKDAKLHAESVKVAKDALSKLGMMK